MLETDKQRRRNRPKPLNNKPTELDQYLNMCRYQPKKKTLNQNELFSESGQSFFSRVPLYCRYRQPAPLRSTTPICCEQQSNELQASKCVDEPSSGIDEVPKSNKTSVHSYLLHNSHHAPSISNDIVESRNKARNIIFQVHNPTSKFNNSYRYQRKFGQQLKPFFGSQSTPDERTETAKQQRKQQVRSNSNEIQSVLPICNPIRIGTKVATTGIFANIEGTKKERGTHNFNSSKRIITHRNVKCSPFAITDLSADNAITDLSADNTITDLTADNDLSVEVVDPLQETSKIICYGESYQGKRSYNEDRWVIKSKLQASHKLGNNQGQTGTNRLDTFKNRLDSYLAQAVPTNSSTRASKQQWEVPEAGCEQQILQFQLPPLSDSRHHQNYILLGVYDGHGGSSCAEYIKTNVSKLLEANKKMPGDPLTALKQVCSKLEEDFLSACEKKDNLQRSGSCALSCLYYPSRRKLFIASIGDCRAYVLRRNQIVQLTDDHKPDHKAERLRIIRHGGKLYKEEAVKKSAEGPHGKHKIKLFSQTRIMPGSLNVSRTLGDIETKAKKYGGLPGVIIAEPDLIEYTLGNPTDEGTALVLCSDGLVQGLQNHQIYSIYQSLKTSRQGVPSPQTLVKTLINEASHKSCDNITVLTAIL